MPHTWKDSAADHRLHEGLMETMTEILWDRNAAVVQIDTSQWGDEPVQIGHSSAFRCSGEVQPVSSLALSALRFTRCFKEAWDGHQRED